MKCTASFLICGKVEPDVDFFLFLRYNKADNIS